MQTNLMTPRQRFIATLTFGRPDRIPLSPGGGRESTRARWHREGLPEDIEPGRIVEYAYRQAGGRLELPAAGPGFNVDERMRPHFEEKVIERRDNSQIVQDWKGNICEIGLEYDVTYLRNPYDFVTRSWLRCPVETRDDWQAMTQRYDPEDPARLPENSRERARQLTDRDTVLAKTLPGPFWQLREWLGFERLCELFIEEPDWVKQMVTFWQDFVLRLLERMFEHVTPDMIHISEDMAYKAHPMIGPEMSRQFLLPCWAAWGELVRQHNIPIYALDSDGDITTLIPLYRQAGFNVVDPMEVAAGIDLPALRAEHGRSMGYRGGFDKRCIAAGPEAIDREMQRLMPVVESGGYIPGCDHGVPADVSWDNFVYYVGVLARATGWL